MGLLLNQAIRRWYEMIYRVIRRITSSILQPSPFNDLLQPPQVLLPLGLVPYLHPLHIAKEVHHQPFPPLSLIPRKQIPPHARVRVNLSLIIRIEQIPHGQLARRGRYLVLQEIQDIIGPAIDDGDADIIIRMVAIAALIDLRAARGDDVGTVEMLEERVGLAGVDHEEHLIVAALLPHLLERVREIPAADLLGVLELQKLVPAVARHVDEHVAARVGAQPFPPGDVLAQPVGEQADEVLDRDLVAAVVDLDVVAVEVEGAVGVVVDRAREGVARVAGHVVGQHEDDLRVRDAQALDGAVEGEDIGEVAVVEPEARGGDEDGPVGGVRAGEGGGDGQERKEG